MKQGKKLIIVESPYKSKTIEKYAGSDYLVVASSGHIRDLAITGKDGLGVNIEQGYTPIYEINKEKEKIVNDLKSAVKEAQEVILATDPDREGEAIAWHLSQVLNLDPVTTKRLEFNEITRESITNALSSPRHIDMNLVHSQETRRILDRLIGFELSKLLKRKIHMPAAGRVQSATLKMIVDHQQEIDDFVPEEKWSLKLTLKKDNTLFEAVFDKYQGKAYPLKVEADGLEVLKTIKKTLQVESVSIKQRKKEAPLPFITSTLQQDAFSRLGFSSKTTQETAQRLYEGVPLGAGEIVGLLTYTRTDSTKLSDTFLSRALPYIKEKYGEEYLGKNKTGASKKKNDLAQNAHEAIRPTDLKRTPESVKEYLTSHQYRLYRLVYNRTIAYLMSAKQEEVTSAILISDGASFKSEGVRVIFPGYSRVYEVATEEESKILPKLEKGEVIEIENIEHLQSYTKPPSQYSEGHLVSLMEKEGIGRPSTYASTIENLRSHNYIKTTKGIISPTFEGKLSTRLLRDHFPSIVDSKYTANMEKELDQIEEGNLDGPKMLESFYPRFHRHILKSYEKIDPYAYLSLDEICPLCGAKLVYRHSRYGFFIACSNYPTTCKYIKKEEKPLVEVGRNCPTCGAPLVERFNKKGEKFIGCKNWPTCQYTESLKKQRYFRKKK